jgi:hypothetical protein
MTLGKPNTLYKKKLILESKNTRHKKLLTKISRINLSPVTKIDGSTQEENNARTLPLGP